MKKSTFVSMLFGLLGGVLFALGMCMTLLPEWNAFDEGIKLGCLGLLVLFFTFFIWRRLEHKNPIHVSLKIIGAIIIAIIGIVLFGVGMSMAMVWNQIVYGTLIGMVGIFALLCLFPYVKGFK